MVLGGPYRSLGFVGPVILGGTCWNWMGGEDWRKKLVRSWDDSLSKIKCRRGCEREAKKDEADLKAET